MELYTPLRARTQTRQRPFVPVVYNCVNVVFVRVGSAVLLGDFGRKLVTSGNTILLGPNVQIEVKPNDSVTYSVVALDIDYFVDQVFWRYSARVSDRFDAAELATKLYPQLFQVIRINDESLKQLLPRLDELVDLSVSGKFTERFNRIQSLWFGIADLLAPYVATSPVEAHDYGTRHVKMASTAIRRLTPLRADVQAAAYLLRSAPAKAWTLQDLAESVHLSRSQLQVVFFAAMEKTPFEYLKMVRVELMAKYLRESQLSVETIVRLVGWRSRSHAANSFRQLMGMSPSEYRRFRAHLL